MTDSFALHNLLKDEKYVAIIFNMEELKIIRNQVDNYLREIDMNDNAITAQAKIINGMKELGGK